MPACYRSRRRRFHRRSIDESTEESATHPSHATFCCSETLLNVNAARGGARVWLRSASSISAMAEVEVRLATALIRGRRSQCERRHPRVPTHRQTNSATAPQALDYEPRKRTSCRFGAFFSAGGRSRFARDPGSQPSSLQPRNVKMRSGRTPVWSNCRCGRGLSLTTQTATSTDERHVPSGSRAA